MELIFYACKGSKQNLFVKRPWQPYSLLSNKNGLIHTQENAGNKKTYYFQVFLNIINNFVYYGKKYTEWITLDYQA